MAHASAIVSRTSFATRPSTDLGAILSSMNVLQHHSACFHSLPTTSFYHDSWDSLPGVKDSRFLLARGKGLRQRRVSTSCRNESSPFTEKNGFQRRWGGPVITQNSVKNAFFDENWTSSTHRQLPSSEPSRSGSREFEPLDPTLEANDIAARLPELREVLGLLRKKREENECADKPVGSVFLVGTGPGDPDLLTLKAAKVLRDADLVLYDRLVSSSILDLTNPGARLLYVGKTSGYHSRTQEEIHTLLLNFAQEGAKVVRLKGGDPLIFGRGGEEIDYLQRQGIQVQIIPGITSASGICAELNIPLTHRGISNSVRFLTGHSRKGGSDPLHVAESAADVDSTLVIYMGLSTLPGLAEKLIQNGLPKDTPSVAVERGTTAEQRFVFSALSDLPSEVDRLHFVSPTLIIVGRVVALSHLWPFRPQSEPVVKIETEPRDRRQRGPDPLLPSQTAVSSSSPQQYLDL